MRFKEFSNPLMEATGLTGRKAGEVYVSTGTDVDLTLVEIKFYPELGQFEPEDLIYEVEAINQEINVIWENKPNKGTLAFGIASFTEPGGNPRYYGRYFKETKAIFKKNSWQTVPKYKYNSKAARKERSGMKPSEVLEGLNLENLSARKIINHFSKKFGAKHPITEVTKRVNSGESFPISFDAIPDMEITAFSNYVCEILHPIAMQSGAYTGQAEEAAKLFLGQPDFSNTTISFSTSVSEGLYDSLLTGKDGRIVKISSKSGAGASASIVNLTDSMKTLKDAKDPKINRFLKKLTDIKTVSEIVAANNGPMGAIMLASHYGIISDKEVKQLATIDKLTKEGVLTYTTLLNNSSKFLTAKLRGWYEDKLAQNPDGSDPYAHILSCVAYKVSDHINQNTNFAAETAQVLAYAGLIQVHSNVKAKGDKWVIQDFKTKYPGTFNVRGIVDPAKYFSSTSYGGKLTFKILGEDEAMRTFFVSQKAVAKKKASKKKAGMNKNAKKKAVSATTKVSANAGGRTAK